MKCLYNVKRSSFIPLKYHYVSTQSLSTLLHLSHLEHEFKNFVVVEIGLLQSQLFINSHLHFIIVELLTTQVLHQRPRQMEV
jgi:hypothetical protein